MRDLTTIIAGWAGGLLFVAAAFGATWIYGYTYGQSKERAAWQERALAAEVEARRVERELLEAEAASRERIARKQEMLDERAKAQTVAWRAMLANLPECRVPRAVGVQLDAAAGVPATPPVAVAPGAGADGAALDRTIELAATLDRVRENYRICQINVARLTEARDWYSGLRERVNSREQ